MNKRCRDCGMPRTRRGKAGRTVTHIAAAFEAGRDGFMVGAAGCVHTASKNISSIQPASRSRGNTLGRRPTGLTLAYSNLPSSAAAR
jgi:hypothetical protein